MSTGQREIAQVGGTGGEGKEVKRSFTEKWKQMSHGRTKRASTSLQPRELNIITTQTLLLYLVEPLDIFIQNYFRKVSMSPYFKRAIFYRAAWSWTEKRNSGGKGWPLGFHTRTLTGSFSLFFFFLMWTIFKVFIDFVTILLLFFMFWFFWPQACGILTPWPGIKPASCALEG